VCVGALPNFPIQISNSQAFAFSRRRASWAFSRSPLDIEGRRNAERRALGLSAAAYFPDCRETEAAETPLSVPSQRLLRPWDRFFRAQARASSPSRQVSPPFTCLVQPLKAEPRSGPGRLPKAPRVHACEAQPRAPHRPSGCPPGQLSLCPASVTPLEAPLIGQDASRISEVFETGIGIHSQVRERGRLLSQEFSALSYFDHTRNMVDRRAKLSDCSVHEDRRSSNPP
jgi:hypothetical protein